ncbi:MAG: radical SAM protein [Acidobacteriota bacterium]
MRVVLCYKCHDLGKMEFYSRFTPLGLGTLNGVLRRAGLDASIVNMSAWPWRRVAAYLRDVRPDIAGISVFTFNRHEAMRVAALARSANPRCLVVAGGPHATHLARHLLRAYPAVDLVVRGEGEESLLELVRSHRSGRLETELPSIRGLTYRRAGLPCLGIVDRLEEIVETPERPVIAELDTLPHPAAYPAAVGVDPMAQHEFIITSRGCPAACTFCSSPDFWGRALRFRSPAHIIEEIRLLRERHGVVYVSVRDDTFTVHRQRVIDLCRGLIESGIDLLWDCQSRVNAVDEERLAWMRRAGCTHVQYGVESGSPRMLRRLNKGITLDQVRAAARATRRVGLGLSIYLITGIDSETDEDLDATLNLIEEIRPHDGLVSPLTVYPGTAQYAQARDKFNLTDDFWVRDRREAFFARQDPWTRRAMRRLRAGLERVGRAAAYGPEDFARQRAIVGDCYALDLSIAEYHERRGRLELAREVYLDLLRRSPRSLWARMRLGHLAALQLRHEEAAEHYRAATGLVPAFQLARALLRRSLAGAGRRPRRWTPRSSSIRRGCSAVRSPRSRPRPRLRGGAARLPPASPSR